MLKRKEVMTMTPTPVLLEQIIEQLSVLTGQLSILLTSGVSVVTNEEMQAIGRRRVEAEQQAQRMIEEAQKEADRLVRKAKRAQKGARE